MGVLEEKPVSLAEVGEILKKQESEYKKEGKETLYEQRSALEHVQKFSKLDLKDIKELVKKLVELKIDLTEERMIKIADLLPDTVDDVRAIFAKERFKYTEEDIKKIIDVVKQYK